MNLAFPHWRHVFGWLDLEAALFTCAYAEEFLGDGLVFNSLEIGVHHGKYFLVLEQLTPPGGDCWAVDLFSRQDLNVDQSGHGNQQIFLQHVADFAKDPQRVKSLELDSLDLDPRRLGSNQFGLISIDGGHTATHTINDLQVGQELLAPKGMLMLDDILNQDWLGVISGATSFFSSPLARRLAPFAIGFNKLFCCHFSHADAVLARLEADPSFLARFNLGIRKRTLFCGFPVLSLAVLEPDSFGVVLP
jgi:hypothetical protein